MKKLLLSSIVASLLIIPTIDAKTSAQVTKDAVDAKKEQIAKENITIVQEAIDAVLLTKQVLVDLEKKEKAQAIKDVEKAIGKLEVVLAKKDAPVMLPIDVATSAVEYIGDVESIEASLKEVRSLLNDHKVQEARVLLNTLQSEIDIVTVSLPLLSYPKALKLAAAYIHDDKIEEAKDVLAMALSTLVQTRMVIPVALLKAEALIADAKEIAKKDKAQALKHLELAHKELEKAELLGYTSSSDITYKALNDAINEIEEEVKGKNDAAKLFKKLLDKVSIFKQSASETTSK